MDHLTDGEHFWFGQVVAAGSQRWSSPSSRTIREAVTAYQAQCARSDAILTTGLLAAPPQGVVPDD